MGVRLELRPKIVPHRLALRVATIRAATTFSLASVDFPVTHAALNSPVDLAGRKYPVALFTPAHEDMREQGTALVEDLASHGYIVVTFGSTYEAFGVEFPGGRIELECGRSPRPELANCSSMLQPTGKELKLRRMDAQFVLAYRIPGRQPPGGAAP